MEKNGYIKKAWIDQFVKDEPKANVYNLFSFFALQENQKVKNQNMVNGRDLSAIKNIMDICEKYAEPLSSSEQFSKFYASQGKANAKKAPSLTEVIPAIYKGENLLKIDRGLAFFEKDLQEVSKSLEEAKNQKANSFSEVLENIFSLSEGAKKTLELGKTKEIETIVPKIEQLFPVDYEKLDFSKAYIGQINKADFALGLDGDIPVTSFKVSETLNKNINTNLPVNVSVFADTKTLGGLLDSQIIEEAAKADIENYVDGKNTNRADKVTFSVYDKALMPLKEIQSKIIDKRNEKFELVGKQNEIADRLDFCNVKITKLKKSNKPFDKYVSEKAILESKNALLLSKITVVDKQIDSLVDDLNKTNKQIKFDYEQIGKQIEEAYLDASKSEVEARDFKFKKDFGYSLSGLKNRIVYLSPVNNKHYILPEHVKQVDGDIIKFNLDLCPCLEDDKVSTKLNLKAFETNENDLAQIEFQNKVFENFVQSCEKLEVREQASKTKNGEFYSKNNYKVFINSVKSENGKQKKVYGYEKIIRILTSVIDSQVDKKIIGATNPKIAELARLMSLEFMTRAIPGIEKEKVIEISEELQKLIIKKAVLMNDVDVPEFDAQAKCFDLATSLTKKAYTTLGVDLSHLPLAHKENGFYYQAVKVGDHSFAQWFTCPLKHKKEFSAEISIKDTENLKLLSLAKFMNNKNFVAEKQKWEEKISENAMMEMFRGDGYVSFAEILNDQLATLYDFSKTRRYKSGVEKMLVDQTAMILTALEKDSTGFLAKLINKDKSAKVAISRVFQTNLTKNAQEIKAMFAGEGNVENAKKIGDAKSASKKIASIEQILQDFDAKEFEEKASENIPKMIKELAVKLDLSLLQTGISYTIENSSFGKVKTLSEDVTKTNSTFKKFVLGVFEKTGSLEGLERHIMNIIKINDGAIWESNVNTKDVVRQTIGNVCQTGFSQSTRNCNDRAAQNAIELVSSTSKLSKTEIEEISLHKFNKIDLQKEINALKFAGATKRLMEEKLKIYEQAEKNLIDGESASMFEAALGDLENKKLKYFIPTSLNKIKKNEI